MAHSEGQFKVVEVRSGSFAIAWVLLVLVVATAVFGVLQGWADRWFWFDEAIHVLSFFAISLVIALYMYNDALTGYLRHKVLLVFTVVCLAVALGVVWEWAELGFEKLSAQADIIEGKYDTLFDLTMDAIGGALAGGVLILMLRPRPLEPREALKPGFLKQEGHTE